MKKERLYGMKVVETVVNAVFLKQGWLVHFEVDSDTDALEAFKHACINYEPRKMEAADKAKVKKEKEDLNEEYQARAWGRQNNHWDRGSSFSHANGQDRYSPGGLPSPRVKTEPTDENSGLFQTPVIPNRGPQTQAGFPTRKGDTQTPGLSHSPIRRPPAPTTPRRKCIDLILTSPS
jgi:hypothetical protein